MKTMKPILVHLPLTMLAQLNHAAAVLRCPRSHVIRRSLQRDLDLVVRFELEKIVREREATKVANEQQARISN